MRSQRRNQIKILAEAIATSLGSGLAPVAPGSVGSAVAIAIYLVLPFDGTSQWLFGLTGAGFIIGLWASDFVQNKADPDPSRVVIDELAGMWASVSFLDKTWPWMLAAFLLFRILDVVKPWPIRQLERLHGGLGIMADDLAAGILTATVLNFLRLVFF